MKSEQLVNLWFEKWENGDFNNLPITEDFTHISPFGTIHGKNDYIDLVKSNRDKFLGYSFKIHDKLYENKSACVRYSALQGKDFSLDVSEWYYFNNNLISKVIAYYHIGEIREERQLKL